MVCVSIIEGRRYCPILRNENYSQTRTQKHKMETLTWRSNRKRIFITAILSGVLQVCFGMFFVVCVLLESIRVVSVDSVSKYISICGKVNTRFSVVPREPVKS